MNQDGEQRDRLSADQLGGTSPVNDARRRSFGAPQISLGFMLLMMVVLATISAGFLYAARVPAVQDEISALTGSQTGQSSEDVGRLAHIVFIMFTFTSPLILAGIMSMALGVFRWYMRRTS